MCQTAAGVMESSACTGARETLLQPPMQHGEGEWHFSSWLPVQAHATLKLSRPPQGTVLTHARKTSVFTLSSARADYMPDSPFLPPFGTISILPETSVSTRPERDRKKQ